MAWRGHRAADWLFRQTLGRLPAYRCYSSDIAVLGDSYALVRNLLAEELGTLRPTPTLLDIGARDREMQGLAEGYAYRPMDIDPQDDETLRGDICDCPQVASASIDVALSFDTFEHVARPWDAARECVRITRPGGWRENWRVLWIGRRRA